MKKDLQALYYPEQNAFPEEASRWRKSSGRGCCRARRAGALLFSEYVFPSGEYAAAGKKILFLTDFHWHGSPRNERLLRIVERLSRETAPDLLLLGGDLVGDASHIGLLDGVLPRLRALAGAAVAVTGNWECGKRWLPLDYWRKLYDAHGIRLLLNETCEASGFCICGTTTLNSRDVHLRCPDRDAGNYPVLLSHAPDTVIALSALEGRVSEFPLILCGHTHGGQWRFPWNRAIRIHSCYGTRFDRGLFLHKNPESRMLISSGLGELSLRGRFFCPPEAVLIRFS